MSVEASSARFVFEFELEHHNMTRAEALRSERETRDEVAGLIRNYLRLGKTSKLVKSRIERLENGTG